MHDTKGRVSPVANPIADPVRRTFVRGLALGGIGAGLGLWRNPAFALGAGSTPEVLRGTAFDLRIGALPVNLTGRQRLATVANDSLPAPTLYWREGDTVTLRVTNNLADASSIHWHGVLLPAAMDGVPGLSFNGIQPGETFVYRFPVRQADTYWYHGHSGLQEQTGVYGAIVIEPRMPSGAGPFIVTWRCTWRESSVSSSSTATVRMPAIMGASSWLSPCATPPAWRRWPSCCPA